MYRNKNKVELFFYMKKKTILKYVCSDVKQEIALIKYKVSKIHAKNWNKSLSNSFHFI
jgi:hypothetical protein